MGHLLEVYDRCPLHPDFAPEACHDPVVLLPGLVLQEPDEEFEVGVLALSIVRSRVCELVVGSLRVEVSRPWDQWVEGMMLTMSQMILSLALDLG